MSSYDDRGGHGAERQRPSQGEQQGRQRRAPLFPLEADDIAPRAHRAPPAPLADLVSDLDAALPVRGEPQRQRPSQDRPALQQPTAERSSVRQPARQVPSAPAQDERASRVAARSVQAQPVLTREQSRRSQELRAAGLEELLEEPLLAIEQARGRYQASASDLARVELATARPQLSRSYVPPVPSPVMNVSTTLVLGAICIISMLVLFFLGGWGDRVGRPSAWSPFQRASEATVNNLVAATRAAGDYTLKGPPSITPQQIDRILEAYNSPATGTGEVWYNLGLQYGIDPAFAVAFFIHESSAGSNPAWAGIKPGGTTTHNVGNIICAGYATCYGRFRDYPSWSEGIEDWYRLIDVEYLQGRGHQTVADVIPVYAPSFENDVQGYVNAVHRLVDQWRAGETP